MTLEGADGTRIGNVADGDAPMDAVNRRQMDAGDAAVQLYADAGDARTLSAAQSYADEGDARTLSAANTYTDHQVASINRSMDQFRDEVHTRFVQMDRRLDQVGAASAAFAGLAMNTAGLSGPNNIGVGFGSQGGEEAIAIGYRRAISPRASISIGGSAAGRQRSFTAGAGFSW